MMLQLMMHIHTLHRVAASSGGIKLTLKVQRQTAYYIETTLYFVQINMSILVEDTPLCLEYINKMNYTSTQSGTTM